MFPVDGLDVWPIITEESTTTPYEEIVLGYNFTQFEIDYGILQAHLNSQPTDCDSLVWSPLPMCKWNSWRKL